MNSTLLRDDAFGGFAERGMLVLMPLGDQFEHAPLSAGELAELRAMGGLEFLVRAPAGCTLA